MMLFQTIIQQKNENNKLSKFGLLLNPMLLLFILIILFLGAFSYIMYMGYFDNLKHNLKNESRYISYTLQEIFDFSSQLSTYLGKQIATTDTQDVNNVSHIIGKAEKNFEYREQNNSLAWLNIGWINANNLLIFDRKYGVTVPQYNLSHRPYVQDCLKKQWKFHTSQVVIGIPSGLRQIPGGMGITNAKGRYLGTLTMCFDLVDLGYKVQQKLSMANFTISNISYVVLDKDLHIVLQSPDNKIDIESSYYKDTLGSRKFFLSDEGTLSTPLKCGAITYSHYKKLRNYPYYVLTGVNYNSFNWDFLEKLSLYIISLIIMGMGYTTLIYFNRKQLLKFIEASQKAKFNFLKNIKEEKYSSLNAILTYSDILSKSLKGEFDIGMTAEKQREMVDSMHQLALNLSNLTADVLNLSPIKIKLVIQECILIHYQTALIKKIKIKTSLYPHFPPFLADELRFKQIITGLLSLSLEFCPPRSLIKVTTTLKCLNDQNFFEIIIQDNGFALNEEAIRRIHEKLEENINGDDISLALPAIEKLIKMHDGTLQLESEWNEGKRITATFPYKKSEQDSNRPTPLKTMDNVHSLFKKGSIS